MYTKYPKGSEWRKWDLHIHTPASPLNNQFGSNWEEYITNLFTKAIENDVKVIGITDYFSIEGYKKILTYLDNRQQLKELFAHKPPDFIDKIYNILLLPNIEFRLNKTVNILRTGNSGVESKRLNFHVIFASRDEIPVVDIEECFLHDLKFVYESAPRTPEDERPLKLRNIEELGCRLRKEHAIFREKSDLEVGMMNAVVDDSDIINLLHTHKSKFWGKYIIVLAEDMLSLMDWDGQDHNTRKLLYQKSDAIFSANQKTIDWCLGKKHGSVNEYLQEFKSFKPCLFGSDAHNHENLFKPEGRKYCWIKANPTFEGLKQVIFEPYDRVKLQENEPQVKESYLFIDKVQFEDGNKKIFDNKYIEFNKYLNSIIGGKSAGKSLLLFHIAQTIDPEQVKNKGEVVTIKGYKDIGEFDFTVVWGDGYVDRIGSSNKKRKITYLPQMFISSIAEKKGALNDWIENLILDNETIKEKYGKYYENILEQRRGIQYLINDYIEKYTAYKRRKFELVEKGDKDAIIKDIDNIKTSINTLQISSSLTPEEIKMFEEQKSRVTDIRNNINLINIFLDRLVGLEHYFLALMQSTQEERIGCSEDVTFSIQLLEGFRDGQKIIEKIINDYDINTIDNIRNTVEYIEKEKDIWKEKSDTLKSGIVTIKESLKPLEEKIQNKQLLDELNKRIDTQTKVLEEYIKQEKEIQTEYKSLDNVKSKLLNLYKKGKEPYVKLKEEVLPECKVDDYIGVSVEIVFESERFNDSFVELLIKRYNLNKKICSCFDENNNYVYSEERHYDNISIIFEKIISGELSDVFKTNTEIQKALSYLLDDYYYIKYNMSQNGEEISNMSPGMRSLLLLKLYIDKTNGSHPILIDQPEENLDNRTIYKDLKKFIKNKKIERQIIIVTHNSNLVVNTDSENIIVANQSGQDNRDYRFEYVTGALEHSMKEHSVKGVLYSKGIREHICELLEGGQEAFEKREQKYGF